MEDLIILSDVHLGSDLNDRLPCGEFPRRSRAVDVDLVRLLEHYRKARAPAGGSRWRLVIAGDFIDFIGMTVGPESGAVPLLTEMSDEEQAHGLGNAEDHARAKLRRVLTRHADVFAALAAFVGDGHALTFVHGNHDLELHWDGVKELLVDALAAQAGGDDAAAFRARIEFAPWFYYVGGVAYVEHGHQYDAYCSTEHMMAPVSPLDPRRIARNFSDVLLRYVVRHTRGLREHGHEDNGLVYYVTFAAKLGFSGLVHLGLRFARAVIAMFRLRRESLSENAKTLRLEHELRMAKLAEATRIGLDRLKALAALQTPPITTSIRGILASVLLDRLALALGSALALALSAVFLSGAGHRGAALACVVVAWIVAHKYLERQRTIDPHEDMIDRAAKLARLFPAAFVVMGHTHLPVRIPVAAGATYINVGSWSEQDPASDEPEAHAYRAARTHLVIRVVEGAPTAEFLTWDSAMLSPRPWQSG